ncbi:UDP-N-acetylmuramate dehydrogenase [Vibrio splendidus]|uniref:UDP-N-acetylmuramate dehydrogenase n=1 Tax=Vibrio splendidus TaxID=29497 RepID=UPI000C842D26|nr:UDP-N-acetylmuramate dehydrogenase [Vibrio splendidus]PMO94716.1 UDP-N-acetylenolpyruvoylglucosamine reductase [Vibrio splendidus]PMP20142.1 UDP-N-acetylenolpyruvoylglucosamine reductase [Vibrio splendidus]PMP36845.1 UDP-N-acetylenolpyruvoylglucosamine reductase [Vibrio splendidus]PMP41708.1 UDP-N-acetylenolpyruvoylglucosamine reductase [Vibrio splendidus]PMP45723.1 UDP-N-acetylenolpyruvoylglucosamine reductase [Vibrio splendidus]
MKLYKDVSLKHFSYWRVGGTADFLFIVNSIMELKDALCFLNKLDLPFIIIGNTSNLLFSDSGVRGGLIKLGPEFSYCQFEKQSITVGAGIYLPNLVRQCVNRGLSGIEHLIGVPATLGGAIHMNAGSQRKSISERLISIDSIDESGVLITRSKGDCIFSYRNSIFQSNSELILSATIHLDYKEISLIRRECLDILKSRNQKFPRKKPSCGSVFISNPSMYDRYGPPGKIIEDIGLKGFKIGGASISSKHANFIVNDGDARAVDILSLIAIAIEKVKAETGFQLESEAKYVSEDCVLINADTAALTLIG